MSGAGNQFGVDGEVVDPRLRQLQATDGGADRDVDDLLEAALETAVDDLVRVRIRKAQQARVIARHNGGDK